jgi:SAM-dependent methyltransferase
MGLLGSVHVDGVVYREFTPEPLPRALGRKGPGFKDYRVHFPDGTKMLIRATPRRIFADLAPAPRLTRYARVEPLIVPGMRILELGCSTGYGSVWLADRVGRSGAVVAIDTDDQAVAFAQKRYPRPNIAFEIRRPDSLTGETDGSFDAVFAPRGITGEGGDTADLAELWRLVAPGGWMLVGVSGAGGSSAGDAPPAAIETTEAILRQICTADVPPSPPASAASTGREHQGAGRDPGRGPAFGPAAGPPPPVHRPRWRAGVIQTLGDPLDGVHDVIVGKPEA